MLDINHQSSKSYITALLMWSQCRSTSPTTRNQPFYLTDLSKLKLRLIPYIPWSTEHRSCFLVLAPFFVLGSGTVLGSGGFLFQYRFWFLALVPLLVLGSSTIPGYGSLVRFLGVVLRFLATVPEYGSWDGS